MHDLPLLINLSVALAYALAGGLIARRIGLPTIVGYLLAGIVLGPWTPGFRGDEAAISQLAEIGVILLMFGVGLHFSFRDLWQVRRVAAPGALIQMAIVTVIGYAVGRRFGFSPGGAWVLGIALSVASTVVMVRTLMDQGWLNTPPGRIGMGWLVFEDLLTVAILVLLPVVFSPSGEFGGALSAVLAIGKALLFVLLMLFVGDRVIPMALGRVVHTGARELFVLVALTVAVGTALASTVVFGVSLALGAFVAGVVVSESPFSHQIGADLLPFREAFAVIFFVSVGMLVDPTYLMTHWDQVLIVSFIVVVVKGTVCGIIAIVLPGTSLRTALVLAAGRSQIGEFSFIVGQSGLELGLLDEAQYSLILAAAIVSITLNAALVRLVGPVERAIARRPWLWSRLDRHGQPDVPTPEAMSGHVVIVGCGRVGRHIAEALGKLQIPRLVIEANPLVLKKLQELGVPVLYGDAANSEILSHAGLSRARALVITLPDDAAVMMVAATSRRVAPSMPVIARASTWHGARRLRADGISEVIRPELEGGLEIVRRTLLDLDMPPREVQRYTDLVRREGLDESRGPSAEQIKVLDDLMEAAKDLQVGWLTIPDDSGLAGATLAQSGFRQRTGVSIVAIGRHEQLIANPAPEAVLRAGDRIALIGSPREIAEAERLIDTATLSR